jgi:hypothetical protein
MIRFSVETILLCLVDVIETKRFPSHLGYLAPPQILMLLSQLSNNIDSSSS